MQSINLGIDDLANCDHLVSFKDYLYNSCTAVSVLLMMIIILTCSISVLRGSEIVRSIVRDICAELIVTLRIVAIRLR